MKTHWCLPSIVAAELVSSISTERVSSGSLSRSGCQETRFEERLQGRDATGSNSDANFNGSPDSKIRGAVEKIALVGLECGCIRKTDDSCCGTTAFVRKRKRKEAVCR